MISNVRNENELRIAIIIDLIDNAHKIGVPRDYYLASRRPSDVSQKIFKGKLGYVGMRSVSAKPSSRCILRKNKMYYILVCLRLFLHIKLYYMNIYV